MDAQALGQYLRESREAREITLDDAVEALKIRRRVLEDFELGQFIIPDASTVQVRGFVRNYARYLGLDEDRIVGYYEAARHQAENPRRQRQPVRRSAGKRSTQTNPTAPRKITDTNPTLPPVPIVPPERPARRSSLLNTLVMLLVAVASIAVIAFVVLELIGRPPDQNDEPGILAQLPPTLTNTAPPTTTGIPVPSLTPRVQQNYTGQGVLVTIDMAQRSWLRITRDGVEQYVGIARPGDIIEVPLASENVTITAANAAALRILFNNQQQPLFGGRGQRVDLVFTVNGVQASVGPGFAPTPEATLTPFPTPAVDVGAAIAALTPSPTPGPSPTPTNTPTITPTPSETPIPSNTPLPSETPTASLTPSTTPTLTSTPTVTNTPSPTLTPTVTNTPSITPTPSPTAILPPRVTQENLPPTKPPG